MRAINEARLSAAAPCAEPIDIRPRQLRAVIRRREARARHFPTHLFGDIGWDLLLDLALARLSGDPLDLRAARTQSPGTIGRWLRMLADEGLVVASGGDSRLSDQGLYAVNAWLADSVR